VVSPARRTSWASPGKPSPHGELAIADQCSARAKSTDSRCRLPAIPGGGVCRIHGGNARQVREAAARRVAESNAQAAIEAEAAKTGRIVKPGQDALTVLEDALADVVAIKERLGGIVDKLGDSDLRYRGRAGEQLRGEIAAYMASMRDVVRTAETLVKLGIAERRQAVTERQSWQLIECLKNVTNRLAQEWGLTAGQRRFAVAVIADEVRALSAERQDRPTMLVSSRPAA
jgi:hypothetical protein